MLDPETAEAIQARRQKLYFEVWGKPCDGEIDLDGEHYLAFLKAQEARADEKDRKYPYGQSFD